MLQFNRIFLKVKSVAVCKKIYRVSVAKFQNNLKCLVSEFCSYNIIWFSVMFEDFNVSKKYLYKRRVHRIIVLLSVKTF